MELISRETVLDTFKRKYFDNETVIRCAELVVNGAESVPAIIIPENATNRDMTRKVFGIL